LVPQLCCGRPTSLATSLASALEIGATGTAAPKGRARIEGFAVVRGTAQVSDNAIVSGCAFVEGDAVVRDYAKVRDQAIVGAGAIVSEFARVLQKAKVRRTRDDMKGFSVKVRGNATMKGTSDASSPDINGTAVFDKDCSRWISDGFTTILRPRYSSISLGHYNGVGYWTIDTGADDEFDYYAKSSNKEAGLYYYAYDFSQVQNEQLYPVWGFANARARTNRCFRRRRTACPTSSSTGGTSTSSFRNRFRTS